MVNLYEKPICYSDFSNKDIGEADIQKATDKIIYVCAYKTQQFVNSHYGNSGYSNALLCDIVQDVIEKVIQEISKYDESRGVPFWAYIYAHIDWNARKAYKAATSKMGESAYVQQVSKKIQINIENGLSLDEIAEKTHHKKSTILTYMNINNPIVSLDTEDENGLTLHDKTASAKEDIQHFDEINGLLQTLEQMTKEERFIVTTYMEQVKKHKRSWKKDTLMICKKKNISNKRAMQVITRFKNNYSNI